MNFSDVLLAMEMSTKQSDSPTQSSSADAAGSPTDAKTNSSDTKRKVSNTTTIMIILFVVIDTCEANRSRGRTTYIHHRVLDTKS